MLQCPLKANIALFKKTLMFMNVFCFAYVYLYLEYLSMVSFYVFLLFATGFNLFVEMQFLHNICWYYCFVVGSCLQGTLFFLHLNAYI